MDALKFIHVGDTFNTTLLEVVWIIVGLITIYAGIKNLLDIENPSRVGTAIFWCSFGIVCAFGTWLPAKVSGVLVIVMCMPPAQYLSYCCLSGISRFLRLFCACHDGSFPILPSRLLQRL